MTNFRSLSGSSLRTQGPVTPGRKSEERPLLQCRNESPRRMGPCVRRDDSLIRHAYENPYAIPLRLRGRVGVGALSKQRRRRPKKKRAVLFHVKRFTPSPPNSSVALLAAD